MATQRSLRSNVDNLDGVRGGKNILGPSKEGSRNVLGNIGNMVPNTRSRATSLKGDNYAITKPERALHRQKATSSLDILKPVPMETNLVIPEAEVPVFTAYSALAVDDIDKDDVNDPQMVTEHVNDVYMYLRQLERSQDIRQNYLQGSSITPKMRSVLIDWLVDVHQQFSLLQETLYLTVCIIDRYLQEEGGNTQKKILQLIGVSAMFIASKYEEMYSPEIRDFVFITDNTYTEHQIRTMEIKMLKTLNFELGRPLPLHFLRRNSKAGFVNAKIHSLAKFIMELSIVEYKMAHIYPSMLAAAALAYSIRVFDEDEDSYLEDLWTPTLVHYSSYTLEEILPFVKELAKLVQKVVNSPQDAKLMQVRKKYTSRKLMSIAQNPHLKSSVAVKLAE